MPSSSEQRPTIHVQTLGGFSIRTNGCQINDNSNQSKKPWALLEYLVIFQKKDINPAELIRIIWADDPGVNPNGALKTLMFRSRKLLEQCLLSLSVPEAGLQDHSAAFGQTGLRTDHFHLPDCYWDRAF